MSLFKKPKFIITGYYFFRVLFIPAMMFGAFLFTRAQNEPSEWIIFIISVIIGLTLLAVYKCFFKDLIKGIANLEGELDGFFENSCLVKIAKYLAFTISLTITSFVTLLIQEESLSKLHEFIFIWIIVSALYVHLNLLTPFYKKEDMVKELKNLVISKNL